jgi:hypothetical protein
MERNNKHMKNSKQFKTIVLASLLFLLLFKPTLSSAQFWIVSGDSAVGLSQKLFKKYELNPLNAKNYPIKIDKLSKHYKDLDSFKVEVKTQKLDFNFSDLEVNEKKIHRIFLCLNL